jgi:serine/threonine-protein kinase HipA
VSRTLEVLLYDELVGHVSELPEGGSEFRFVESYHEMVPRPVLGQKFEDDLDRVHRSRRGQNLPDFFANLAPEGRLREVIEKAAEIEPGDALDLLSFVGRDLPGAVMTRPVEGRFSAAWNEAAVSSSVEQGRPEVEEGLRFSLAGVQLKLSMLRREDKLTLPASDQTGEWIVKFDSEAFPHLPENEYSMLVWAEEAGFDVPECHLHPVSEVAEFPRRLAPRGTQALAVRRYDRTAEGERIHQEDFAQAVGLPPTRKYDVITYEVMARLVEQFIDREAVDELIRRLAFVTASGNNDAHLKNWSLVYPDRIRARWSPLYDQVSTIAWTAPDRALSLKLAGVKEFHQLDRAAFERLATKAALDTAHVLEQVDETLSSLRSAWQAIRPDLPLPEGHAVALAEHWQRVPLLRDHGPLD